MAGNMGNIQNKLQNLKVLKVDAPNGILVVKGTYPAIDPFFQFPPFPSYLQLIN